jgi:hypothetical protein
MLPEPPQNAGYMVAAYVVAGVILVGYAGWLIRKAKRVLSDEGRVASG